MEIVLSVLIPSTIDREWMTLALREFICINTTPEEGYQFELLIDWSDCIIGKKRNDLLKIAKGKYIVFVDSDDIVSPNYISLILEACKSGSDCIGISGVITTNGGNKKQWHISRDNAGWYERDNVYYRTPNHISPVKRELALQAGFPEISFAEDAEYSRRLVPLLKTETKIEQNIYHYKYVSIK